jgi:trehalose 6-phosphate phosphatase
MQSGFHVLSQLSVTSTALFLDFDGTLACLVDRPENVRVNAKTLEHLARTFQNLDGALAIVTGRDLAALDEFLAPHIFPASGIHGFETRTYDGSVHRLSANLDALGRVAQTLAAYADQHKGLLLETKPASIALHYRLRPELKADCEQLAIDALGSETSLRIMQGKMVIEIKAHEGDKGQAVAAFLEDPPFKSRIPVFIGDDITDEAAFAAINARSGISIKVGAGDTAARYRLAGPSAVHDWLDRFAAGNNHQGQKEGVTT